MKCAQQPVSVLLFSICSWIKFRLYNLHTVFLLCVYWTICLFNLMNSTAGVKSSAELSKKAGESLTEETEKIMSEEPEKVKTRKKWAGLRLNSWKFWISFPLRHSLCRKSRKVWTSEIKKKDWQMIQNRQEEVDNKEQKMRRSPQRIKTSLIN